jgi:hypothetical protein
MAEHSSPGSAPIAWLRKWMHGPEVMKTVVLASPSGDKPMDVPGTELIPLYGAPVKPDVAQRVEVTDGTHKEGDVLSYEIDETTRVGRVTSHTRARGETVEELCETLDRADAHTKMLMERIARFESAMVAVTEAHEHLKKGIELAKLVTGSHVPMEFHKAAQALHHALNDTQPQGAMPTREQIAQAIYEVEPFYESGEYVDGFQVSPGGALSWKQALARDAEFADDILLPVTKFAFDAADAVISLSRPVRP